MLHRVNELLHHFVGLALHGLPHFNGERAVLLVRPDAQKQLDGLPTSFVNETGA